MYRLKKEAPGSRVEINPLFKEIKRLRNEIKGVLTSGQSPTQLRVKLVQNLKRGVGVHAFNPSTPKAEAGRPLSLRPAWPTEQVQGQPSLGNEGNQGKTKACEDITDQRGSVPFQEAVELSSFSHAILALEHR